MIDFEAIRDFREKKNLTQEQLAEKLGLSRNGYAKIERGESTPSLERLDDIASALGVRVIELLKLENKNMVCQIGENQNHSNNNHYYHSDQSLQIEIEKLKLIIAHKDEIIALKDEIIKSLQS